MLKPVLLSGGVGSRLWPVSREAYPKQFLPLAGENSMLADTLHRVEGLSSVPPMVVCNDAHRFIVAEQVRELGLSAAQIVLEPCGRNTAPAVAVAALEALKTDPDAVLLVLPADHLIENSDAFRAAVTQAMPLAEKGRLVTFGIVPSRAETGFGYIRRGEALVDDLYAIDSFVEKPDSATAQSYIDSGEYLWNSGMFLLGAQVYLDELTRFAPAIVDACQAALEGAEMDLDFVRLASVAFESCPGGRRRDPRGRGGRCGSRGQVRQGGPHRYSRRHLRRAGTPAGAARRGQRLRS